MFIPCSLVYFLCLASSIYHTLWVSPPWLPLLVPSLLPDLLMWECPRAQPYIYFLGDLIQSHGYKFHLYTSDSKICPVQTFTLQVLVSICPLGISTWMSNQSLKLNPVPFISAKPATAAAFPILVDSNPLSHHLSQKNLVTLDSLLSHTLHG